MPVTQPPVPQQDRAATLVRVVLAAGLTGLAAWSFRPVFDETAGLPLLWAILAPTGVAAGWGCLAVPFGRRMLGGPGTALAVLLIATAAAAVTRPGSDVRLGPSRLLTAVLPVNPSGPELATISVLAGLTAVFAVRLAVGSRGSWWPLVPALCSVLLGLGLGAATGPLPAWYPPAFVATGLTLVLAGRTAPGLLGRGRLVTGGALVLVAAAAGLELTPLLASHRAPASLQSLSSVPVSPKEDTNPLARYLALRDNLVALDITGTASEHADRIRMVTLTEFTGQTWTVRTGYRRAGTRLPGATGTSVPTRTVSLDLRVQTPGSLGWLPRVGRPIQISVADMGFDGDTGDVVVPAGRDTPTAYQITGGEPDVSPQDLRADDPAVTAPSDLRLPPELLTFADTATAGRSTGLGQFLGLYEAMTGSAFSYDTSTEARGGNGLRQIAELVSTTKRGTSEQYASAFAVLSRHLGWDARVVLGFRPTWTGNQFRIQGQDVYACVEVRFQRLGWVSVDPSPTRTVGEQGRPGAEQPKPHDAIDEVPPPDGAPVQRPLDNAPRAELPAPGPGAPRSVATLAGIALAVVVLGLLSIPLAVAFGRARARRTGSNRRRTLAAWQDVTETLRGAGIPVSDRMSTGRVVEVAGHPLASHIRPLADVVDRAAYSADAVPDAASVFAWQCSDAIRRELRRTVSTSRALRRTFNPAPLLPTRKVRAYQFSATSPRPSP